MCTVTSQLHQSEIYYDIFIRSLKRKQSPIPKFLPVHRRDKRPRLPTMFAAATSAASSYFKASAIHQNYSLTSAGTSISSTPSPSAAAPQASTSPFHVGLWRVQEAVHKNLPKRVSVWSFERRDSQAFNSLDPHGKERVIEVLKAEARSIVLLLFLALV